jgi:hypothetical protein
MSGAGRPVSSFYGVNSPRLYGKQEPVKDEGYKRFIRKLPCAVCCGTRRIEAAHFGPRGLGQKSNDRNCLPLCYRCHQTSPISYHQLGPMKFALAHHLDPQKLIEYLNRWYEEKGTARWMSATRSNL